MGSLILGLYERGKLRVVGHTSGFRAAEKRALARDVVSGILSTYADDDASYAWRCLERNGGVDALRFADYDEDFQGGHRAGDRVLEAVAAAMREWVRGTDSVARIGGDEFAALLLQMDAARAAPVVERLREAISVLTLREGDATIALAVSAGIAVYPEHGADAEALLSRADGALYEAKRQGRNRVALAVARAV